ncbi:MAG: amino acid adenylation domain-containing protein, partial [Chloroflexi bacterium]
LFEEQAERTPDAIAVVFEDQQLTYAQLNARANQLAHYLRKQGVGPEVLVGICMERSLEMIVGLLGILKAGGAYVPLDPAYPADRLMYMLADSGPLVLLTQHSLLQRLPLATLNIPVPALDAVDLAFDRYPSDNPNLLVVGLTSRHPAYVIYTSGSTGRSKGVIVEHRSAVNFWKVMQHSTHRNCPAHARVALNASITFDMSLKGLLQLLSGHCLFIVPQIIRADGTRFLNFLKQHQIDAFDCTPSQLELMLTIESRDEEGYYPKNILIGGEAIQLQMWEKLRSSTSINYHNMYGPTECTVDASIGLVNGAPDRPHIGRPIANTQIFILDPQGQTAPLGVIGEIHIGGVGVARGYFNRPDLTAEKFIPNPFSTEPGARIYRTGDLARWLPDGNIEFLGRIDRQVKIRGFRIELGEIEAALAALPEVREVVVLAREDTLGDKRLVAYLVMQAGHDLPEPAELRSKLARSLPEHMLPAHFISLEQLPLTPNGKIDHKALPAPDTTRNEVGYVAPRNIAEETLAQIWAEVLKLDKVGIHDNFFELGGHSLLATQLISRLRAAFQIELPLLVLFEATTVAELAQVIEIEQHLRTPPGIMEGKREEGEL